MKKFMIFLFPFLLTIMVLAASYRDYGIRQLLGTEPTASPLAFSEDSLQLDLKKYGFDWTTDSFSVEVFVSGDGIDTIFTHRPVLIRNTGNDITVTGHLWAYPASDTIDVLIMWGNWTGPYYGWKWDTMFVAETLVDDTTFIYNVSEHYSLYEVGGYWGIKIMERQEGQVLYGIQARAFEW